MDGLNLYQVRIIEGGRLAKIMDGWTRYDRLVFVILFGDTQSDTRKTRIPHIAPRVSLKRILNRTDIQWFKPPAFFFGDIRLNSDHDVLHLFSIRQISSVRFRISSEPAKRPPTNFHSTFAR